MEVKPWIAILGRIISLPLMLIAGAGVLVWHVMLTLSFGLIAAYLIIREVLFPAGEGKHV